jgi:hypothetical protein
MKKIFALILAFSLFPIFAFSQEGTSLTLTPTLIKVNVVPGQVWSSFLKVVNTNPTPLTVYLSVFDFKGDEKGGVSFVSPPENEEAKKFYLSSWIEISKEPIEIPPNQSKEIPFTIKVPKDASAGGYYSAILVGTQPVGEQKPGTVIKISQQVSCLILLTVEGEILEKGWIREFSSEKSFYQKPEVKLNLVFENLGNVHLQPVGEIKIYNIWGKEKGKIEVNQKTEFGNVLPKSKRIWNFEWKGEESLFEIGRYRAEAILHFGRQNQFFDKKVTYFWIVPLVPVLSILGAIILFFLFLIFLVRLYVKRAVKLAQMEIFGEIPEKTQQKVKITPSVLKKPIQKFIVDLKSKKKEK